MAFLNCRPSVIAAAIIYAERRARGIIPFWPSMLSKLTHYQDMSTPELSVAIKAAQVLPQPYLPALSDAALQHERSHTSCRAAYFPFISPMTYFLLVRLPLLILGLSLVNETKVCMLCISSLTCSVLPSPGVGDAAPKVPHFTGGVLPHDAPSARGTLVPCDPPHAPSLLPPFLLRAVHSPLVDWELQRATWAAAVAVVCICGWSKPTVAEVLASEGTSCWLSGSVMAGFRSPSCRVQMLGTVWYARVRLSMLSRPRLLLGRV